MGARTFWNAYRLTTTTPLFERSNRSMFSGFAAGRSFVHSRSSIRRRSTPAFYGWPTCSHFNPIWTSSCTLLRLERNARRFFQEIRRPVFSLLEKGPLAESCTYLSYDSLRELGAQKHLAHLSDTVLDEYAEEAE